MTDVLAGADILVQERRLVTEVPGPRSRELTARRASAVSSAVGSTLPVFVERAGGGVVVDVDGNSLIDLGSGIAVVNVGNAAPEVVAAVQQQVAAFTHTCFMVTPTRATWRSARNWHGSPRVTTRRSRPCSTPGPRRSRTRSRSPGTPPGVRPWSCST